jgi:hypothetical protein
MRIGHSLTAMCAAGAALIASAAAAGEPIRLTDAQMDAVAGGNAVVSIVRVVGNESCVPETACSSGTTSKTSVGNQSAQSVVVGRTVTGSTSTTGGQHISIVLNLPRFRR